MIDSRQLRDRITFQTCQKTQDPTTGALTESWVNYATVWAKVEPMGARELRASRSDRSEVLAKITIRYRDDLAFDMRIIQGSDAWEIDGGLIPDNDTGREWITIPVKKLDPSQFADK